MCNKLFFKKNLLQILLQNFRYKIFFAKFPLQNSVTKFKLQNFRLSKSDFFRATNISVWKFCANKMGQKQTNFSKNDPKKVKQW